MELFLGRPGAGKSFLAERRVCADSAASGRPILAVDAGGTVRIEGLELVTEWRPALELLAEGRHVRLLTDREPMAAGAWAGARVLGGVVHYVDELVTWSSAWGMEGELARLVRQDRHARSSVYMTTQHVGDLPAAVLGCASRVFVFRHDREVQLERIRREFDFAPDRVRALKRGEYLEWSAEWEERAKVNDPKNS